MLYFIVASIFEPSLFPREYPAMKNRAFRFSCVRFHPCSLSTPLIPAMSAPPPVAPMSPMDISPTGMSPSRALSPHRYLSPPKQTATPERALSPPSVNALQSKSSPPSNHQRPPSPPGQAPPSSGSASSSSDSGSDSGSDSSDDSEGEESTAQPAKGPSTPPSVSSPKLDSLVEEPPPAVEESKRRWDLSSFFNKTAVQYGEQNSESKPAQVRAI